MSWRRRLMNEIKADWGWNEGLQKYTAKTDPTMIICTYGGPWEEERHGQRKIPFGQTNKATFIIVLDNKQLCKVTLHFKPGDYPFRPPNVKVGKNGYKNLLGLPDKWIKLLKIKDCPCCCSIVCNANWYSIYHIRDILTEIRKNLSTKLRIRNILLCKQFTKQKFGFYLPIEEFL